MPAFTGTFMSPIVLRVKRARGRIGRPFGSGIDFQRIIGGEIDGIGRVERCLGQGQKPPERRRLPCFAEPFGGCDEPGALAKET
jgi:hypothetical protein